MLSAVCWKWGKKYGAEHVNKLRAMTARNLTLPHEFFCITDDTVGLDKRIHTLPLWTTWPGKTAFSAKHRARTQTQLFRMYDPSVEKLLGKRVLQLDLDLVIVDDITPTITDAPLVIYKELAAPHFPYAKIIRDQYNISVTLMDVGALSGLWNEIVKFTDSEIRSRARRLKAEGRTGNVQCFVGDWLDRNGSCDFFTEADGYYGVLHLLWEKGWDGMQLPSNARVMLFYGPKTDPSKLDCSWVKEHWRC